MRRLPDPFGEVFFANSQVTDRPTLFLHGDGAAVVCAWMHNRSDWQADAICAELLREVVRRGWKHSVTVSPLECRVVLQRHSVLRMVQPSFSTKGKPDDLNDLTLRAVVEAFGEEP